MASQEEAPATTDLPMDYKMDYKRRGLALIFNQKCSNSKLKKCYGTATTKANLTERLQELGFHVKEYDDIKRKNILCKIEKAASGDHTDADCFVCVFLSHGDEDGHMFGSDAKAGIKEVTNHFRGDKCRSLVGKPKIFIFQASCSIPADDAVTGMAGGSSDVSSEVKEDAAKVYTLPAGADFLMCYGVSEGFYIEELCEILQQQSSSLEFTELLTLVSLNVSKRCTEDNKQMPFFTSMLTKKLYFRPKENKKPKTKLTIFSSCLIPKTS